jgi:hypothetical protein
MFTSVFLLEFMFTVALNVGIAVQSKAVTAKFSSANKTLNINVMLKVRPDKLNA